MNTVEVGPLVYAIIEDPALVDSDEYGEFRPHAGEIALRPGMPPTLRRETLLHEVEHAVAFVAGFRDGDKKYTEEEFVTRCSPIRSDAYRRNPGLVDMFLEPWVRLVEPE